MVISTIRMVLPVEKYHDALRVFRILVMQYRDCPGCLSFHIYRDTELENVLMLQGNWETEEKLGQHIRSNEYRNLLLVLEMSLEQPEIRFDTISSSTGIETIEQLRSASRLE